MNTVRRRTIGRMKSMAEHTKLQLETVLQEEQDCFDNMPEALQASDSGLKSEEAITALEEAISSLELCIEELKEITS